MVRLRAGRPRQAFQALFGHPPIPDTSTEGQALRVAFRGVLGVIQLKRHVAKVAKSVGDEPLIARNSGQGEPFFEERCRLRIIPLVPFDPPQVGQAHADQPCVLAFARQNQEVLKQECRLLVIGFE